MKLTKIAGQQNIGHQKGWLQTAQTEQQDVDYTNNLGLYDEQALEYLMSDLELIDGYKDRGRYAPIREKLEAETGPEAVRLLQQISQISDTISEARKRAERDKEIMWKYIVEVQIRWKSKDEVKPIIDQLLADIKTQHKLGRDAAQTQMTIFENANRFLRRKNY